ncbi:ferredoxin [Nocardia sp. NPDC127526]|uniref:ferredoxin n=1 Tax=Nocardia sp. NPDC127526 TaxID=3345393 RepID=UPI00363189A9
MSVHITADRNRCIGAGMCTLLAPQVFDQDEDDGRVQLLDPEPPDGRALRDALNACPSGALTLHEAHD